MEATKLDINHKFESLEKKIDQLLESNEKATNWDSEPLLLDVKDVKRITGLGTSTCYELFHQESFKSIVINGRFVITKENFRKWLNEQSEN